MQIEIKIDASCKEPKITVTTDRMTDELNGMIKRLADNSVRMIAGFKNDTACVLQQEDIFRIYSAAGKIYADTYKDEYVLKSRLYELEERLDKNMFVRISNSEIINLKKVTGFDLSLAGTICVKLSNGTVTYVSRRYVAKIKQVLGI